MEYVCCGTQRDLKICVVVEAVGFFYFFSCFNCTLTRKYKPVNTSFFVDFIINLSFCDEEKDSKNHLGSFQEVFLQMGRKLV